LKLKLFHNKNQSTGRNKKNTIFALHRYKTTIMGKGDKKSRRGKIFNKSYGVRRRRKKNSSLTAITAARPKAQKKTVSRKEAPKKEIPVVEEVVPVTEEIVQEQPLAEEAVAVKEEPKKTKVKSAENSTEETTKPKPKPKPILPSADEEAKTTKAAGKSKTKSSKSAKAAGKEGA
jgi:ribosomal small subunit protein bTHX